MRTQWTCLDRRSIGTLGNTEDTLDNTLQSSPKLQNFEDGIEYVSDDAIISVFGARMMSTMVLRCLQKAIFLKDNHQIASLASWQVIPFVDFVSIDPNSNEQQHLPC